MKKHIRLKLIIIYYLLFTIFLAISNSLARYSNTVNITSNIEVAEFNLKINGSSQTQTINLSNTVTSDGYGGNLIIPGSTGTIPLTLDFTDIEVATTYKIEVDSTSTGVPNNMTFYIGQVALENFTGTTTVGTTTITHNIVWTWPFSETDESAYMDSSIIIKLNVIVEQDVS